MDGRFRELMRDDGFLQFQNDLTLDIYDKLGQGFSSNENEVALVTGLCEVANGKSYGPVSIRADKIHGSRSYVEFKYRDKPVTKELGDMAIISIVSDGRKRLFQRLCIIQNKKASRAGGKSKEKVSWNIDLEQLYLLKNFPRLSGDRGILRNCSDLSFRNTHGSLGAFCLLQHPGEMTFITAPLLTELMKGKKSLNASDISVIQDMNMLCITHWHHPFSNPFFGHASFLRDMYDFVRGWTQINIGEICVADGKVINTPVDGFANALLRQIGFADVVELPPGGPFGEFHLEANLGVAVTHIDIGRKGKD